MIVAVTPTKEIEPDADTGSGWSTQFAEGSVSADGRRYRLRWWVDGREYVRKKALFRVVEKSRIAVLLHIRVHRLSQRVSRRISELDDEPELNDIPAEWRALMRADGFTPVAEEHQ